MAWLLDTHALLWALYEPAKLGRKARTLLEDPTETILVSPISYWEISLKSGLGKLSLPDTDPSEIPDAAAELGVQEEPVPSEVFATFHRLPYAPDHRDPFDRLLVWQAISGKHGLLSRDKRFKYFASEGLRLEW
jgi:PIN domain nuclease of toxin-antitoxin system